MLDNHQVNKEIIELELERIKLLFLKNNYDTEQKKWFIEAKRETALKNNDANLLEVCKLLEESNNNA